MASPFRNNKKERRRYRKRVKKLLTLANQEDLNPEIADSAKRIAAISARIGQGRRNRKRNKSN
jgi:hypothetical protein